MIRTTFGLLALLALAPPLPARDEPKTLTPAQQYQALVKQCETTERELEKALEDAKTPQEQQKVVQKAFTQLSGYYTRFLALAEKNPKDPAAVDALIWVLSRNRVHKYDPQSPRTKSLKILLRDHVKNEKMATVCQIEDWVIFYSEAEEGRQLLHAVLEKSPHDSAKAQACLALAQQSENRLRMARQFKDRPEMIKRYESLAGKEAVEALVKADPDKLSKETEGYYERIAKDFAKEKDLRGREMGKLAERKLETLRHPILVGKPAPDIEGEDIDGAKFKLSDYRGKVVLLDFWGNW